MEGDGEETHSNISGIGNGIYRVAHPRGGYKGEHAAAVACFLSNMF